MANPNNPFGLKLLEGDDEVKVHRYVKKSGNAIYQGDPVIQTATGDVDVAVAGGTLLGVAAEFKAALDVTPIAVIDDPDAYFEIQASGAIAATDVFANANLIATAGDAVLKRSKMSLDVASLAATSTLQLKVVGKAQELGNDYASPFTRMVVRINNHAFNVGVAGV